MLLAALCTLPTFGILIYSAWRSGEVQIDRARASLQARAESAALDLGDDLRSTDLLLRILTQIPAITQMDPGSCSRRLAETLPERKLYANALVFAGDARAGCSAVPLTGREPDLAALVKRAQTSGLVEIGSVVFSPEVQAYVLPAALAARDDLGRRPSVLVLTIKVARAAEIANKTFIDPGAAVALVQADGRIVYRWPEDSDWSGKSLGNAALASEVLSASAGSFSALGVDGVERLFGFASVPETVATPLKLALSIPRDVLLQGSRQALQRNVLLLLVVMLAAFAIAWALGEFFVRRRLIALASVVRQMAAGDLAARAPKPYSHDEFGAVSRAFDAMAESLEKSRAELGRANVDLEHRVAARTRELEEANRELEAFSYSISHDLRTPLRHQQAYADLLAREANDGLTENARRYLRSITQASTDMAQLLEDLLAFSRMGRVDMMETTVELDALVAEVIARVGPSKGQREIEWKVAPLPAVEADPAMLRQVLINLLDNAVKYTGPRARALIEIGTAGEEEGRLVVYVRDNGVGFEMQYAKKLFGVFQRLHSQNEFEGTGIGLAIVRRIIERHGGRIRAQSTPGEGATFFFTLRAASLPEASATGPRV